MTLHEGLSYRYFLYKFHYKREGLSINASVRARNKRGALQAAKDLLQEQKLLPEDWYPVENKYFVSLERVYTGERSKIKKEQK